MDSEVKGLPELRKKLERLGKLYPEAMGAALYQEGMSIWRNAVKKAPVEFGVLRNSAYVSPPFRDGGEIAVEIGFGTKYAVFQHERKRLKHPRGGEAGFLRSALNEAASGFLERLAQRTEQNVEKGVRAPAIGAPTAPRGSGTRRRSGSARLSARRGKR